MVGVDPQNLFWPLIEAVLGVEPSLSYEERKAALLARGIGLWDVLKSCTRTSSLDSDIDDASIVVNDFVALFKAHPSIQMVCFNGQKAAKAFEQHVAPALPDTVTIAYHPLPSTSPANARIPFDQKLQAWRKLGPSD